MSVTQCKYKVYITVGISNGWILTVLQFHGLIYKLRLNTHGSFISYIKYPSRAVVFVRARPNMYSKPRTISSLPVSRAEWMSSQKLLISLVMIGMVTSGNSRYDEQKTPARRKKNTGVMTNRRKKLSDMPLFSNVAMLWTPSRRSRGLSLAFLFCNMASMLQQIGMLARKTWGGTWVGP